MLKISNELSENHTDSKIPEIIKELGEENSSSGDSTEEQSSSLPPLGASLYRPFVSDPTFDTYRDISDPQSSDDTEVPNYSSISLPLPSTYQSNSPNSWDPLANYGMWTSSFSNRSVSPSLSYSVMSTIIAGQDSFVARLYWETMSRLHSLFIAPDLVSQSHLQRIYIFKGRYWGFDNLQQMTETTLNLLTLRTATFPGELFPDEALRICTQGASAWHVKGPNGEDTPVTGLSVGELATQAGEFDLPEPQYMDVYAVDRYLRGTWALEMTSTSIKPAAASSQSRQESEVLNGWFSLLPAMSQKRPKTYSIETLLDKLAVLPLCMGAGPRYEAAKVEEIVREFMGQ